MKLLEIVFGKPNEKGRQNFGPWGVPAAKH